MPASPRFGLILMATSSVQKERIFNEAIYTLDALVNPVALTSTATTPPVSPELGDVHIVAPSSTGAWAGEDNNFAIWLNGWKFVDPIPGLFVFCSDDGQTRRYNSGTMTWGVVPLAIATLADIPDVDTTGLADGNVIVWDSASSTWVVSAAAAMTGAEIKVLYEAEANTNEFTDAEKTKLAGLDDSLFLGVYVDTTALTTAHPSPAAGSYAYVDGGIASDIMMYVWDDTDSAYVNMTSGGSETPASVKSKYESNADTNALTDALLTKLNAIEAGATADQTAAEIEALLDAYYGGTSWRTSGSNPTTQDEITGTTYSTVNADFETGTLIKRVTNATGCTVTVTAGHTNTEPLTFIQTGAGQITFAPDTGVTIESADGHLLTRVQFSSATLIPDTDTAELYYLVGDITT